MPRVSLRSKKDASHHDSPSAPQEATGVHSGLLSSASFSSSSLILSAGSSPARLFPPRQGTRLARGAPAPEKFAEGGGEDATVASQSAHALFVSSSHKSSSSLLSSSLSGAFSRLPSAEPAARPPSPVASSSSSSFVSSLSRRRHHRLAVSPCSPSRSGLFASPLHGSRSVCGSPLSSPLSAGNLPRGRAGARGEPRRRTVEAAARSSPAEKRGHASLPSSPVLAASSSSGLFPSPLPQEDEKRLAVSPSLPPRWWPGGRRSSDTNAVTPVGAEGGLSSLSTVFTCSSLLSAPPFSSLCLASSSASAYRTPRLGEGEEELGKEARPPSGLPARRGEDSYQPSMRQLQRMGESLSRKRLAVSSPESVASAAARLQVEKISEFSLAPSMLFPALDRSGDAPAAGADKPERRRAIGHLLLSASLVFADRARVDDVSHVGRAADIVVGAEETRETPKAGCQSPRVAPVVLPRCVDADREARGEAERGGQRDTLRRKAERRASSGNGAAASSGERRISRDEEAGLQAPPPLERRGKKDKGEQQEERLQDARDCFDAVTELWEQGLLSPKAPRDRSLGYASSHGTSPRKSSLRSFPAACPPVAAKAASSLQVEENICPSRGVDANEGAAQGETGASGEGPKRLQRHEQEEVYIVDTHALKSMAPFCSDECQVLTRAQRRRSSLTVLDLLREQHKTSPASSLPSFPFPSPPLSSSLSSQSSLSSSSTAPSSASLPSARGRRRSRSVSDISEEGAGRADREGRERKRAAKSGDGLSSDKERGKESAVNRRKRLSNDPQVETGENAVGRRWARETGRELGAQVGEQEKQEDTATCVALQSKRGGLGGAAPSKTPSSLALGDSAASTSSLSTRERRESSRRPAPLSSAACSASFLFRQNSSDWSSPQRSPCSSFPLSSPSRLGSTVAAASPPRSAPSATCGWRLPLSELMSPSSPPCVHEPIRSPCPVLSPPPSLSACHSPSSACLPSPAPPAQETAAACEPCAAAGQHSLRRSPRLCASSLSAAAAFSAKARSVSEASSPRRAARLEKEGNRDDAAATASDEVPPERQARDGGGGKQLARTGGRGFERKKKDCDAAAKDGKENDGRGRGIEPPCADSVSSCASFVTAVSRSPEPAVGGRAAAGDAPRDDAKKPRAPRPPFTRSALPPSPAPHARGAPKRRAVKAPPLAAAATAPALARGPSTPLAERRKRARPSAAAVSVCGGKFVSKAGGKQARVSGAERVTPGCSTAAAETRAAKKGDKRVPAPRVVCMSPVRAEANKLRKPEVCSAHAREKKTAARGAAQGRCLSQEGAASSLGAAASHLAKSPKKERERGEPDPVSAAAESEKCVKQASSGVGRCKRDSDEKAAKAEEDTSESAGVSRFFAERRKMEAEEEKRRRMQGDASLSLGVSVSDSVSLEDGAAQAGSTRGAPREELPPLSPVISPSSSVGRRASSSEASSDRHASSGLLHAEFSPACASSPLSHLSPGRRRASSSDASDARSLSAHSSFQSHAAATSPPGSLGLQPAGQVPSEPQEALGRPSLAGADQVAEWARRQEEEEERHERDLQRALDDEMEEQVEQLRHGLKKEGVYRPTDATARRLLDRKRSREEEEEERATKARRADLSMDTPSFLALDPFLVDEMDERLLTTQQLRTYLSTIITGDLRGKSRDALLYMAKAWSLQTHTSTGVPSSRMNFANVDERFVPQAARRLHGKVLPQERRRQSILRCSTSSAPDASRRGCDKRDKKCRRRISFSPFNKVQLYTLDETERQSKEEAAQRSFQNEQQQFLMLLERQKEMEASAVAADASPWLAFSSPPTSVAYGDDDASARPASAQHESADDGEEDEAGDLLREGEGCEDPESAVNDPSGAVFATPPALSVAAPQNPTSIRPVSATHGSSSSLAFLSSLSPAATSPFSSPRVAAAAGALGSAPAASSPFGSAARGGRDLQERESRQGEDALFPDALQSKFSFTTSPSFKLLHGGGLPSAAAHARRASPFVCTSSAAAGGIEKRSKKPVSVSSSGGRGHYKAFMDTHFRETGAGSRSARAEMESPFARVGGAATGSGCAERAPRYSEEGGENCKNMKPNTSPLSARMLGGDGDEARLWRPKAGPEWREAGVGEGGFGALVVADKEVAGQAVAFCAPEKTAEAFLPRRENASPVQFYISPLGQRVYRRSSLVAPATVTGFPGF